MNSVGQNKFCTVAVQFLIGLHIVIGGGLDHTDQSESLCNHAVCGEELFLTSFLSSGRIAEGREAAKVTDILPGVSSYSGFFTVNETLGSNLFFWFFPAESGSKEAPIVLWLNGGPGRAFADTLFRLNGPFTIVDGPRLMPNLLYWSEAVNVIFIDIPVGTGFSFTKSLGNHSQQEVGSDLLSAVKQFFQLFPEYSKNEFYIIGQSYGGKYATSLAYLIHQSNPRYRSKINLSGVAIGGGWIDPVNQIDYSPYLYYLGLIDLKTQQKFADVESQIKSVIKKKNYGKAFDMFNKYFLGKFSQPSLAENVTGFSVWNNYLENDWRENDKNIDVLMNNVSWRKSMHVGDVQFNLDHPAEFEHIRDDYMVSVAPWLETLMDHYRVLLFNGELDVVCPYPLAINYVRQLKWKGAEMYSKAQRKQWHVLGSLAGYAKTAGNFTEVLLRDTGHEVLQSRLLVLDILSRFTRNISFDVPTH
ncbi:hypothetical protein GE061_014062 [Apolygus lucorum]|uniref:Carboxypeptidase n=1 Tax=Apolygus lucorum TaxID=248454 RepID=A0A6A4KFU0_APOLU|nr:hypothetical protein GE061_014062 [Apolygus lucorum]